MTTAAQPDSTSDAQPQSATACMRHRESTSAPSTPGAYAFQWEMVQDGVEHFGDFTPLVTVQVTPSEVGTPDGLLTTLWDNDNLLLELDSALTVTGRYTDAPGTWGGLVSQWQQAQLVDGWNSPSSSFYGFDSQGSTRILTNPAGVVTDAYAYQAFGTPWQGGNGSTNAYRYVGEYGYYRDSENTYFANGQLLASIWGRWINLVNLWPDKHRAAVMYQYSDNSPLTSAWQRGGMHQNDSKSGIVGIATCYRDIGCAHCKSPGKTMVRDKDCCSGYPLPDKCRKRVWQENSDYYGAFKISDPKFNCFDIVKVHRLIYDRKLKRYVETEHSVSVTIVDNGHLQNTPRQGFPGLGRIIDLKPVAMQRLLSPTEKESCNSFLVAVRAERVGHGFPPTARICWNSNCVKSGTHHNRPNSECL